jgi:hypothetical protein
VRRSLLADLSRQQIADHALRLVLALDPAVVMISSKAAFIP